MSFSGDPLAFWGKLIVEEHDAILFEKLRDANILAKLEAGDPILANLRDIHLKDENGNAKKERIGILGAGIAGLYTALILESLDIEYDILEASDRVGGRISTHKFRENGEVVDYYDTGAMRYPLPKKDVCGKYKNGIMRRVARLIEYGPLNQGSDKLGDQLIPFLYAARDRPDDKPAFRYFNGVHQSVSSKADAPHKDASGFRAKDMGVGERYIKAGAGSIHSDVTAPFISALVEDLQTGKKDGWYAVKQFDAYSLRGYMASKYLPTPSLKLPPKHLSSNVINWCNLLAGSSGGYDRALTSLVFSALSFANIGGIDYGKVDWKCFRGGSETLTNRIHNYLLGKQPGSVKFGKRVTAIEQVFTYYLIPGEYSGKPIPFGATKTRIIQNPPCYRIDIEGTTPSYWRLLRYPELQVTARDSGFQHYLIPGTRKLEDIQPPFHIETLGEGGHKYYRIVIPGDNPPYWRLVRSRPRLNVVPGAPKVEKYSYHHVIPTIPIPVLRTVDLRKAGLHILQKNALRALDHGASSKIAVRFKSPWWTEKLKITGGQSFTDLPIRTIVYPSYEGKPNVPSTVLIASYAWTTDASRIAAPALNPDVLKDLVLRNLAEAHYGVNGNYEITYDFLVGQLADGDNFHVRDWNADEFAMGAYPFFSPGEFENLYASLTVPAADGTLHFAGEIVSTRHSWAVAALDSGWRAVDEYLQLTKQTKKLEDFKKSWGENSEWTTEPPTTAEPAPAPPEQDGLGRHVALSRAAMFRGVI